MRCGQRRVRFPYLDVAGLIRILHFETFVLLTGLDPQAKLAHPPYESLRSQSALRSEREQVRQDLPPLAVSSLSRRLYDW